MDTSHEMMLLVVAAVTVFFSSVASVAGEIRCYCNDAGCVRDGYMCKSALGQCFSQLTYERDSTRSVHGCAESLPLPDRDMCEGIRNIAEVKTGDRVEWPVLLCCKNDMCNYMDNLDINIYVTKNNGSKTSMWIGSTGETAVDDVVVPGAPPYPVDTMTSQRDLWFKAAVIAVPIAGGFILVFLVLLAVRVLKNDNRRHRQLMQMRHHRSMTKAQLYVADHFYHNELIDGEQCNNTHCHNYCNHKVGIKAKLAPSPRNSVHDARCTGNAGVHVGPVKGSHVYKDVHIKVDNSKKHRYEKIRPVSDTSSILEGSCNSIILWGDPNKTEVAATV